MSDKSKLIPAPIDRAGDIVADAIQEMIKIYQENQSKLDKIEKLCMEVRDPRGLAADILRAINGESDGMA